MDINTSRKSFTEYKSLKFIKNLIINPNLIDHNILTTSRLHPPTSYLWNINSPVNNLLRVDSHRNTWKPHRLDEPVKGTHVATVRRLPSWDGRVGKFWMVGNDVLLRYAGWMVVQGLWWGWRVGLWQVVLGSECLVGQYSYELGLAGCRRSFGGSLDISLLRYLSRCSHI